MAGVSFSHPHPAIGSLFLRLAPTQVDWNFVLNKNVQDTYGGQVIQILSINFDKLTISGQFGKEGSAGALRGKDGIKPRSAKNKNQEGMRDYSGSGGVYSNGLTQMTEYFTRYFNLASQGVDNDDNYEERPMTIRYEGALTVPTGVGNLDSPNGNVEMWKGYPTKFPSYARSNENFAPKWQVEFEVYEAPEAVKNFQQREELDKLRDGVGWRPNSEWSDPLGGQFLREKEKNPNVTPLKLLELAKESIDTDLDDMAQTFSSLMPAFTDAAIQELLLQGASIPNNPR